MNDAIAKLVRHDPMLPHGAFGPFEFRQGKIADPYETDLSLIHQLLHRGHRFFDGHGRIGPVQLVEINGVNAELAQTGVGGVQNLTPTPVINFGSNENSLSNSTNRQSDDLFVPIILGGVNERGSKVNATTKQLRCSLIEICSNPDLWDCHAGWSENCGANHQLGFKRHRS